MHDFDYARPATIDEAAALLGASPEARLLAGGMTLLPTMKQRLATPERLIDLGAIPDITGIAALDGTVTIGAMTTHAAVAASDVVRSRIPALAELAGGIGDPQVRNRGTLGGSIANADPAADYPAALVALDATVATSKRTVPADAFFTGLFETALAPDELIRNVTFRTPEAAAYAKFANSASGYAIVGVFVARFEAAVRVAVTGAGPAVFRLPAAEAALVQSFAVDALPDLGLDPGELNGDIHAEAGYRAHLVGVMLRRAVAAAGTAR
ncbi:MAG: xanthine dehydrogenase family protein subunit M [Alphaproteobacteria bacterium]